MSKSTRKVFGGIVVVMILSIVYLVVTNVDLSNISPLTITNSALINNNPGMPTESTGCTSPGTFTLSANDLNNGINYTCNAPTGTGSACYVYGYIDMSVPTVNGIENCQTYAYTTDLSYSYGTFIKVDKTKTGVFSYYKATSSSGLTQSPTCSIANSIILFTDISGNNIIKTSTGSNLYICKRIFEGYIRVTYSSYSGGISQTYSPIVTQCTTTTKTTYDLNTRLCTSSNSNTDCNTESSKYNLTAPASIYTKREVLVSGEKINFMPIRLSGSPYPIDKYKLYYKVVDCKCANQCIKDSTTCEQQLNVCPSGYKYNSNVFVHCISIDGNRLYNYVRYSNICDNNYICYSPISSNKVYKTCNAKDSNGCNTWSSLQMCSEQGYNCIVDATNKVGSGIGACQCTNQICRAGETQCYSSTQKQLCYSPTNPCLSEWRDIVECGTGVCGITGGMGKCVCPTLNASPGDIKCSTTDIYEQYEQFMLDDNNKPCYKWVQKPALLEGWVCIDNKKQCVKSYCDGNTKISCLSSITDTAYGCKTVNGCSIPDTSKAESCSISNYPAICVENGTNDYCKHCDDNDVCTIDTQLNNVCKYTKVANTLCCNNDIDCKTIKNSCNKETATCELPLEGCETVTDCSTGYGCESNKCVSCNDNNVCTEDVVINGVCNHKSLLRKDGLGGICCFKGGDCNSGESCNNVTNKCNEIKDYCESNSDCVLKAKSGNVSVGQVLCNPSQICVCPIVGKDTLGNEYCTVTEKDVQKCGTSDSNAYTCKDDGKGCYTYQKVLSCDTNYKCEIHSPAACYLIEDVNIFFEPQYGIGEQISGRLEMKDNSFDGTFAKVYLYKKGKNCPTVASDCEDEIVTSITNKLSGNITFRKTYSTFEDLTIKANVSNVVVTRDIEITTKLFVVLISPLTSTNIGDDIQVPIQLYDVKIIDGKEVKTQIPVSSLSKSTIKLVIGDTDVTDFQLTSTENIKFTPKVAGYTTVTFTGTNKDGITTTNSINFDVVNPGEQIKLLINSKEPNSFDRDSLTGYIKIDTNKLITFQLQSTEANSGLKLISNDFTMRTPAGTEETIKFDEISCDSTKKEPCIYKGSFTFKSPGNQYILSGRSRRVGGDDHIISQGFLTLGDATTGKVTDPGTSGTTGRGISGTGIVSIIGGIVAVLVIGFLIFRKKR